MTQFLIILAALLAMGFVGRALGRMDVARETEHLRGLAALRAIVEGLAEFDMRNGLPREDDAAAINRALYVLRRLNNEPELQSQKGAR